MSNKRVGAFNSIYYSMLDNKYAFIYRKEKIIDFLVSCLKPLESIYKGLARSLRSAIEIDPRQADRIPSTKGTLGGSL